MQHILYGSRIKHVAGHNKNINTGSTV